jgi:hypothetical protein
VAGIASFPAFAAGQGRAGCDGGAQGRGSRRAAKIAVPGV